MTALHRAVVSFPMEKFMKVLLAKPNRSKRGSLCQRASKTQKSMNVAKDPAKSLPIKNVTSLPPSILTGEDMISLMRKHRITISVLAVKVGSSQRRVRLLRHTGLIDAAVIRDWLEAITGQDPGPVPRCCKIENAYEGAECHFCRYPLFHDDVAWRYADRVYCTMDCCVKSCNQ